MIKKTWKLLAAACICAALSVASPASARAAEVEVETSTTWYARIDAASTAVRETAGQSGKIITQVIRDQMCEVAEPARNGWIKIITQEGEGYIQANRSTLIEKTREKVDSNLRLRRDVVNYALQFVGNRYVYGGTDPHSGVDCSGFTRYVMQHMAGISLSHNSTAQSREGTAISYSQAKPGDLIFYGNGGGSINHVAIYMGDGQIVHASSAKTGIKVSSATSRSPVKVVRVLR